MSSPIGDSSQSPVPSRLLVTGCYRSGTTLLEKILHQHPAILMASQPFPMLYAFAKQRFLKQRGLERIYSLDSLFLERDYRPEDLSAFLDREVFGEDFIGALFDSMAEGPSGTWTPELLAFRDRIRPGRFADLLAGLEACLAEIHPKENLRHLGTKEVLIEELSPWLLDRGVRVLFVLRDPRAVIASVNFRERDGLTGEHRPVLYSLRVWRKSVALALQAESSPLGLKVHYENLVTRQRQALRDITDALGVEPFAADAFDEGLRDQRGATWRGNSSFADHQGISRDSLRTFESRLPDSVLAFVEATCEPEMAALGHDFLTSERERSQALRSYSDPLPSIHARFPADYSSRPAHLAEERRRRSLLLPSEPALDDEREVRAWFLSPVAYHVLRAALGG